MYTFHGPLTHRQYYTVSKKWGTHIVPHRSHKNRALSIRFGTVNRKSILAQIDKSRETFIPEVALLTEDVDEVLPMISLKHVTQ